MKTVQNIQGTRAARKTGGKINDLELFLVPVIRLDVGKREETFSNQHGALLAAIMRMWLPERTEERPITGQWDKRRYIGGTQKREGKGRAILGL